MPKREKIEPEVERVDTIVVLCRYLKQERKMKSIDLAADKAYEKAEKYYRLAAEQGHEKAKEKLRLFQ